MLPMQKIEFVTVKQMYDFSRLNQTPLLSNYNAEFWSEYLTNYARYDRVFNRLYKNFYYFNQDANLTADEVQPEFTEDVYGLLLMNHKKYSELYRVHVVDDDTYSIIDNYDVTETKEGENAKTITDSFGQKIENIEGSKDLTDLYGQRITSGQNITGNQSNSAVDRVAPYNSENFSNENRNETTLGQRTDTSSTTQNTVTDTHNTDTETTTTYNAHEDTHEHEGSDSYELHRKGNIGVQTQSEVMQKHVNFWKGYSFYKIIFDDICKELLLIERGYI